MTSRAAWGRVRWVAGGDGLRRKEVTVSLRCRNSLGRSLACAGQASFGMRQGMRAGRAGLGGRGGTGGAALRGCGAGRGGRGWLGWVERGGAEHAAERAQDAAELRGGDWIRACMSGRAQEVVELVAHGVELDGDAAEPGVAAAQAVRPAQGRRAGFGLEWCWARGGMGGGAWCRWRRVRRWRGPCWRWARCGG